MGQNVRRWPNTEPAFDQSLSRWGGPWFYNDEKGSVGLHCWIICHFSHVKVAAITSSLAIRDDLRALNHYGKYHTIQSYLTSSTPSVTILDHSIYIHIKPGIAEAIPGLMWMKIDWHERGGNFLTNNPAVLQILQIYLGQEMLIITYNRSTTSQDIH